MRARRSLLAIMSARPKGNAGLHPPARFESRHRLNAICPYFTMFPLDFPLGVLSGGDTKDWVLDPFCGRGTTLFAARVLRMGSIGIDTNPVACALAEAKLAKVAPIEVVRRCEELLTGAGPRSRVPKGDFWELCFHPETLKQLCQVRGRLQGKNDSASIALRALILGILHGPLARVPTYLSNQMPRTYATKPKAAVRYWRRHRLRPSRVDMVDAVTRRANYVLSETPARGRGNVRWGDARQILPTLRRQFNWVITSPPYYGMRTYLPDQWLRAWFLGDPPTVEYSPPLGQIASGTEDRFVSDLADVWRAVARRCLPGARLVVRFGALPSVARSPSDLLLRSLRESGAAWEVDSLRAAGTPPRASRQAHQFAKAGEYVHEIDVHASLSSTDGRR